MKIISTVKIALFFSLICFSCFAQLTNSITGNYSICTDPGYQINAVTVSDGSGGAIVAWIDGRSTVGYALFVQRIDASGIARWTTNGVAICTIMNDNAKPIMVADGNGGAIFVWKDIRNKVDSNVYAQRINAEGVVQWANNGVEICAAIYNQIDPKIVSDANGGAIITWQDLRSNTSWDIYAQKINVSGERQWALNGIPISTKGNSESSPTLVADGSGGAIIAWRDEINLMDTSYSYVTVRMFGQRIDSNGIAQWVANEPVIITPVGYTVPVMISDGLGGAIIAWEDWRLGLFKRTIFCQRINALGLKLWSSTGVVISSFETFDPKNLKMIADGLGGAIITWYEKRGKTDWDIYAQKINDTGITQWQTNGVVVSAAAGQQYGPAITTDGNGGAIIAWSDIDYIYAQSINSAGVAQWPTNGIQVSNYTNIDFGADIVSNDNGGATVTWTRHIGNSYLGDIYAQRLSGVGLLSLNNKALSTLNIQAFPNPTKGFVTIQSSTSILEINLINELGQVVYTATDINSEKKEVDLSKFSRGLYLYKVSTIDGGISTGKLAVSY